MLKIEYEIKLNESGRPCIELSEDYEDKAEDKFFAIELARYFLQSTHSRMTSEIYDQHTINTMDIAIRLLGQLGDEMAEIQYNAMKAQGELAMVFNVPYHIQVNSIEERDALPEKNILYKDKIFDRIEGLKVATLYYPENLFISSVDVYELVGGITNENWVKI